MSKHEKKYCPRCNRSFECKVGSISQCQCSEIRLTPEERAYIESLYQDCLCIHCLFELQAVFRTPEKHR